MTLSPTDRFRLKGQICDEFTGGGDWNLERINLLFSEFGLDTMESWGDPSFSEILRSISDTSLSDMYAAVMGIDRREVDSLVESSPQDDSNWKKGYVRVFISHSAHHKAFVGKVAEELAVAGIHGFVAHDTMSYSKPWQEQIEHALRTMQAFVLLVHPEVNDSAWCHQEIGWALGRRVPHYVIRLGTDPGGFIGRDQWPSSVTASEREVANIISTWVAELPELGPSLIDGMFETLANVQNYMDAGAAATRLASLDTLTDTQFDRLAKIWWSNDQLHGGILATRGLEPLYQRNGRSWPPTKPAQEI